MENGTNQLYFDIQRCILNIHNYIVYQRDNIAQLWFKFYLVPVLQDFDAGLKIIDILFVSRYDFGIPLRIGSVGYHHILHLLNLLALGRYLQFDFIYLRPYLLTYVLTDSRQYLFVKGQDGGISD